MRVRKLKDKDIDEAVVLMNGTGLKTDSEVLKRRLQYFQYRRNHAVVVLEQRSRLAAIMHVGIVPSLTKDRNARIYALFIVKNNTDSASIEKCMIAYGRNWAEQHGCDLVYSGRCDSVTQKEYIEMLKANA